MGRTEKPMQPTTPVDGDGVHPTVGSWHSRFSPVWPHEAMWRKRASEDFRWSEGKVEAFGEMSYWARQTSWWTKGYIGDVSGGNLNEPAIIARDGDTGEIVWSYYLEGRVNGPPTSGSGAYFHWRSYGNGDYPGEHYYQDDRWRWELVDLTVSRGRVLAIYERAIYYADDLYRPWHTDISDYIIVTLSRSTGRAIGIHRYTSPWRLMQPFSDEYPETTRWHEYTEWWPNPEYNPNLPTISEGTSSRYEYALKRGLTNWGGVFINVDADGNHFLDQSVYWDAFDTDTLGPDLGVPLAGTDASVFRGKWKAEEYHLNYALNQPDPSVIEYHEEQARLSAQAWSFWKDFYEGADDVNPSYMGYDRYANFLGQDKMHRHPSYPRLWHFEQEIYLWGRDSKPSYLFDLQYYASGASVYTNWLMGHAPGDTWAHNLSGVRYGDVRIQPWQGHDISGHLKPIVIAPPDFTDFVEGTSYYDLDYVFGEVFRNMPGSWGKALESWTSGVGLTPHSAASDGDGNFYVIGDWIAGPDGIVYTGHHAESYLTAEEYFNVREPVLIVYDSNGNVTIPKQNSIAKATLITVNPVTQNPVLLNRLAGFGASALTEYEYNGDHISAVRSQWSFRIRADGNWLDLNETGDDGSFLGYWRHPTLLLSDRDSLDAIHFDRNGFMWVSGGMRRRRDGEYRSLVAKIDWNGSGDIIEINDLREPHRDRTSTLSKRRWTGEKKDIEAYWKFDGEIADSYPTDSEINEETGHSSYLSRNEPPTARQGTKIVTGLRPDSSFTRVFVGRYPSGGDRFIDYYGHSSRQNHFGVFCYDDFKASLGAPDTLNNYLRRDWHWDIDAPSIIFDIAGAPGEAGAIS